MSVINFTKIQLTSYNSKDLIKSCSILKKFLEENKVKISMVISLPKKKRIYCVLRSPHADKDSREHFEVRIHKKVLVIKEILNESIYQKLSLLKLPFTELRSTFL
jgi:small subunit ribosomal protein S10